MTETKILLETQLSQTGDQLDEAHAVLTKQEKALEEKLAQSIQAQNEADKRAAIAEARGADVEKQ